MDLTMKICKYNSEDGAQFIPIKHGQYVKLKKVWLPGYENIQALHVKCVH